MKKITERILITGSGGFVGRNLIECLQKKQGWEFEPYDTKGFKDVRDKLTLEYAFMTGNFDAVVHLAARAGVGLGQSNYEEYISTNITGTQNVIEMCKKYNVKNLVFYSSSSVYGGRDDAIGEKYPLKPIGVYGMTKVAGEHLVKMSGLNYVIIIPFSVYGEKYGRRESVVYKWIDRIKAKRPIHFYGDGTTSRGYTYVKDLTEATLSLTDMLIAGKIKDVRINLGGNEIITLQALHDLFSEHCYQNKIPMETLKLPLSSNDIPHSFANISLAKELIGFTPKKDQYKEIIKSILNAEL